MKQKREWRIVGYVKGQTPFRFVEGRCGWFRVRKGAGQWSDPMRRSEVEKYHRVDWMK